jgi:hypothetical protein
LNVTDRYTYLRADGGGDKVGAGLVATAPDARRHVAGVGAICVLLCWLSACRGAPSSLGPPPPTISVSISPAIAAVQTGATARLTATVANDTSSKGVTWTVSCSATQCGTIAPVTTASGAVATYTAPATMPSSGNITVTATAVADQSQATSATLTVVGHIPGYDVGVDYHAYGTDNLSTAFITIYDQPMVRQTVRTQLQGMADRGATFINTMIWFVTPPGGDNLGETWRATFPMSDQEAANLRAYAQDVAAIQGASGNRLRLDISLAWLGAADYTMGTPTTGLGSSNLSASAFSSRVATTTDKVLAAVSDVTRPDGIRLVNKIFFKAEVLIPGPGELDGNPNEGWFLTANYPRFVSVVSATGIQPAVYFYADGRQVAVLDNGYVDALYPILDGHRSMFWIYRALKFMSDSGLPIPAAIEFSCYLDSTGAPYAQLLQRILDDADATLPSLGAPKVYGAAETYYLANPSLRLQYGQVFPAQAALNSRLQRVSFWTTPGGGPGMEEQDSAYPFTIEDFLPPPPP